jgi:hypothetical protein
VVRRLLAAALSLLATSGILELGFRVFAPQVVTPRMNVEAPLGGHRVRPHIDGTVRTPEFTFRVTTNSLGLREGTREIPAMKSTYRILGLGDSFAFGLGVDADHSYLRRTEQCLNAAPRPGGAVEVINAGIPASGTADQLAFFLDVGRGLEPDLVWLSFYYNDVQDNWNADLFSFSASGMERKPRPEGRWIIRAAHRVVDLIPLFGWVRERSHVVGFLSVRLSIILEGLRTRGLRESQSESGGLREDQWRTTERLLEELSRQSQLAVPGRPAFFLSYIPYKFQILPPERPVEQNDARLARDIEGRLQAFAARRNFPFLSLTERFRAAPTPASLYFRRDHHLSDEGNRLVGEAACPFLHRQVLERP